MGIMALAVYLGLGVVAWLIDRRPVDAGERLPGTPVRA
jgi:hypothetical protein